MARLPADGAPPAVAKGHEDERQHQDGVHDASAVLFGVRAGAMVGGRGDGDDGDAHLEVLPVHSVVVRATPTLIGSGTPVLELPARSWRTLTLGYLG